MKKTWEVDPSPGEQLVWGGEWMACHFVLRWAETQQLLVTPSKWPFH